MCSTLGGGGGGGVIDTITENVFPHTHTGLLMGSLQLVVAFAVEDSLGGSSSYCTVLSQVGLRKWVSYFTDFHKGIGNWWQVKIFDIMLIFEIWQTN